MAGAGRTGRQEAARAAGGIGGGRREQLEVASPRVWDRNAVSWEDPRAAAAFVTIRDPLVESLSRTAGAVAREQRFPTLNENLVAAMGVYYASAQAGIRREADPGLPCAEPAGPRGEVDRPRFPRETLLERTADCAEMEILYCTMLESLGVESALVIVPGRLYPAFSLGVEAAEARGLFRRPEALIVIEGRAWVPVQLDDLAGGFLEAWGRGSEGWREQAAGVRGQLLSIRDAWRLYAAVELPETTASAVPLDRQRLAAVLHTEMVRLLDREFWGR